MKHIADIELTEYVAGNLPAARAQEVREHMAACPECSQRGLEADRLWNTLGDWSVETAGHDVADRVVALAREARDEGRGARDVRRQTRDEGRGTRHERRWTKHPSSGVHHLWFVLRVAASIIIAVGVGHKLGEYSVTGEKPQVAASQDKPDYLAALGLEWSSGLAWLVLEEAPAETGAEQ